MAAETWRKCKAFLLIGILTGAEAQQVQEAVRRSPRFRSSESAKSAKTTDSVGPGMAELLESLMAGQNTQGFNLEAMMADRNFQQQAKRVAEQFEAMMTGPNSQMHSKHAAGKIEGIMADSAFQTKAKRVADQLETMIQSDPHLQQQTRVVEEQMEKLMSNSKSPEQAQQVVEQLKAVMADPKLLGHSKRIEQEIEAMTVDPALHEKVKAFAKEMETMKADGNAQKMTETMETMSAEATSQEKAKSVVEQMEALMGDAKFKEQAMHVVDQMQEMAANPSVHEEAAGFAKLAEGMMENPSFERLAEVFNKQMEVMMEDPKLDEHAEQLAQQMQAVQGKETDAAADQLLRVEEQTKMISKHMEMLMADSHFQKLSKQAAEPIEEMMAETSFQSQANGVAEKLKAMTANPKLQEQVQRMAGPLGELMSNMNPGANVMSEAQHSRGGLVDNLVDNLFDGAMKASTGVFSSSTLFSRSAFSTRPLATSRLPLRGLQRLSSEARGSSASHVPTSKSPLFVKAQVDEPKGLIEKLKSSMPARGELKKMLPLAFMFFCILFCYTVLRDTKDVLVVTSGGAEVIPFLKTYMNLPAAIGFTTIYAQMVNKMSNQQCFYTILSTFAAFFGAFALFIYPASHTLHPIAWAEAVAAKLPVGFAPIISIIKFWTFGTFYTFAELWGSVVVSVLFWGFANEICSVKEATTWYPLFGLLANVALIFSGQFIRYVSDVRTKLPPGVDAWGYSLNILMAAVVTGAGIVLATYTYMQKKVLTDPEAMPQNMEKKGKKKKKPSMGLVESFKYLGASSYIRNLFFLVISYGISINIVEVTWKSKLKAQFPDPNDYSSFMGAFSSSTGAITLVMMLVGRWIFTTFGWGTAALVTPLMLGATGVLFFSLLLFKDSFAPLTAALGFTPLMMAVLVGAAQNILSKSSKYSLFDPCKETAYIPLDAEMRTKGKAAIDVIGNPLGKSGGAFIQQGALLVCGSLAASTPFLGGVLFVMVGLWIGAAKSLAVEFEEKAAAMKAEAATSAAEESAEEETKPAPA